MHPKHPLERFQALLRFPTISRPDEATIDVAAFERFAAALPTLYPSLHASLEREVVADHSLLYRWRGSSDAAPAVLMAHYDVVPATDEGWQHPPFAAVVTGEGPERVLWGRGSLDDKGALVAILEAVEGLVAAGYTPEHDVYLSFGHNEETAGGGAIAVASLLESRGIRPALVLDEGGAIVEGIFPTVTAPAAVIGVAEKGLVNLLLSVEQEGGHASTPPRSTATTRLARAVTRLAARPYPARFSPTNLEMIRTLGAHATGPLRTIFRAATITRPLLQLVFARLSEETSAMVRTTLAVTQLSGSAAANVLAERATATVNIRVAVGSTVAEAVDHVRRSVRDSSVRIEVLEASEPSPVSPTVGPAWSKLSKAITDIHPGVVVTPYIQLGASDSRRFTGISNNVYRFTPFEMSKEERGTLHAMNERIHVDTWLRGIEFYVALLRSL